MTRRRCGMDDLEKRILAELGRKGRGPLDKVTLGRLVGIDADDRKTLREALKRMEASGRRLPARNGLHALSLLVGFLPARVMVVARGNGSFHAHPPSVQSLGAHRGEGGFPGV